MIISPADLEKPCTDGSSICSVVEWCPVCIIIIAGLLLSLWHDGIKGKIATAALIIMTISMVGIAAYAIVCPQPPEQHVPFTSSIPPETLTVAYDSGTITFTNPVPDTITKIEVVQNGLISHTLLYSVDLAYREGAAFPVADLDEVRVSKINGNSTEFSRYHVLFGRDSEGRNIVRIR